MPSEHIGQRIRRCRESHDPKLTQSDLAARMQLRGHRKLNVQRISEIELGQRSVDTAELVSFARSLGVPITYLLGVPDFEPSSPPKQ